MASRSFVTAALFIGASLGLCASAFAQNTKTSPMVMTQPNATSKPVAKPMGKTGGSLYYLVHQIQGRVRVAPIGTDPMQKAGWRTLQRGERLGAGLQIHTSWRGKIKLVARPATPATVIMLESGTLLSIDELAIKNGVATSRLGLGYGAIRAGVAEGEVRSDMEITCPVAALSKKGTDIFRFEYANGRFTMSLSEQGRGLLQAIQLEWSSGGNLLRTKSRFVTPGQFVTQRMLQAIEGVQFDREININDLFGIVGNDRLFTLLNDRGLGFLLPQGGNTLNMLDTHVGDGPAGVMTDDPGLDNLTIPMGQVLRRSREGDFGIGQGILPGGFLSGLKRQLQDQRNQQCRGRNHEICKTDR